MQRSGKDKTSNTLKMITVNKGTDIPLENIFGKLLRTPEPLRKNKHNNKN